MQKDFLNIAESNEEMLTYFNRLYSEHESNLQEYKAKLFEINIKLDELSKTRNIYSLNTDYRRSIFSPISSEQSENEKEKELKEEIRTLTEAQHDYEDKIDEETIIIKSIDKKVKKLTAAKDAIARIFSKDVQNTEEIQKGHDRQKELEKQIEEERQSAQRAAIENKNIEQKRMREEMDTHFNNILMIDAFDRTFYATVLDKKIKNELIKNNKILEHTRHYIAPDPSRAKADIDKVIENQNNMLLVIDEQLKKSNYYFDDNKTVRTMLTEFVQEESAKHPDILIEYSFAAFTIKPDYVHYAYLYRLLYIFFDNIYKHSKANYVTFVAKEADNKIEISIVDNGRGIGDNYLATKEWYSGLHRAKEIIYMLSGDLEIKDNKGTEIKFSIPL